MDYSPIAHQILDVAQELVQTRGYNAFSYRDLAAHVGIRTASIHYHFPTKGDLGRALLDRYRHTVLDMLAAIDTETVQMMGSAGAAAPERLRRYAAFLEHVLGGNAAPDGRPERRICLGGMLASDYATLPPEVQAEVRRFVEENERWLARVLTDGRTAGTLAFAGASEAAAAAVFAALEGAMFTARSAGDPARYARASAWLLSTLDPGVAGGLTAEPSPVPARKAGHKAGRAAASSRSTRSK